jgi:hypothetical protein
MGPDLGHIRNSTSEQVTEEFYKEDDCMGTKFNAFVHRQYRKDKFDRPCQLIAPLKLLEKDLAGDGDILAP